MADVEMADATALAKKPAVAKTAKSGGGADTAVDSKKKFEVKKVRLLNTK